MKIDEIVGYLRWSPEESPTPSYHSLPRARGRGDGSLAPPLSLAGEGVGGPWGYRGPMVGWGGPVHTTSFGDYLGNSSTFISPRTPAHSRRAHGFWSRSNSTVTGAPSG